MGKDVHLLIANIHDLKLICGDLVCWCWDIENLSFTMRIILIASAHSFSVCDSFLLC